MPHESGMSQAKPDHAPAQVTKKSPPGHKPSDTAHFPAQLHAAVLQDPCTHGLAKSLEISRSCIAGIDQEVAVQL